MHVPVGQDAAGADKAPGIFIEHRAERFGVPHEDFFPGDIAQQKFEDGARAIFEQNDAMFQVEAPPAVGAPDDELGTGYAGTRTVSGPDGPGVIAIGNERFAAREDGCRRRVQQQGRPPTGLN
jgi:hypothetical protein